VKFSRAALIEIDPERRAAFASRLRGLQLEVSAVAEADEVLRLAGREIPEVLVLGAVPGKVGPAAAIERLRATPRLARLPLLAIAPKGDDQKRALGAGADDVFDEEASDGVLWARLRALSSAAGARAEVHRLIQVLVLTVRALEAREPYRIEHSLRVSQYAAALARLSGLSEIEVEQIRLGGLLHDLGKVSVPDGILYKATPLTEAELALVRAHPVIGYDMLRDIPTLEPIRPLVLRHHERIDGSGYPDGLTGREIPANALLIAIADAYDAITSARPYRQVRSHDEAMAVLEEEAARGLWDPDLVRRAGDCFAALSLVPSS
jgi:putative two-component system response regulator